MRLPPFPVLALALLGLWGTRAPAAVAPIQSATYERALTEAEAALARGDAQAARGHYLNALDARPGDRACLLGLVQVTADEDERALWQSRLAMAALDAKGRLKLEKEERKVVPKEWVAEAGIDVREDLLGELERRHKSWARGASKDPVEGRLAAWARSTAEFLVREVPALSERVDAWPEVAPFAGDKTTIDTLGDLARQGLREGRPGLTLEAARLMRALATQAQSPDLQGPSPGNLSGVAKAAADYQAQARELLGDLEGPPLEYEDLMALDAEERRELDLAYKARGVPSRAYSPEKLYMVESYAGLDVLIEVTSTVEGHHARLVDFYGADPFADPGGDREAHRRGTVRVLPDHGDVDGEGRPWWWAAGFQAGDVTTLQFAVGDLEGLGHTLTHELTHRFDGALLPGLPPWLVEGRAVWTGGAYEHAFTPEFERLHAQTGTLYSALNLGYQNAPAFRRLLTGDVEEYRDYYTIGYALWTYLYSWDPRSIENGLGGQFEPALGAYLKGFAERPRDPVAHFVAHFCDGAAGRPRDLEQFVERFTEFLRGFNPEDRAAFTRAYKSIPGSPARRVTDRDVWVASRAGSEPFFGSDVALRAARLFAREGRVDAARTAFAWAESVDEPSPEDRRAFAALEEVGSLAHWSLTREGRVPDSGLAAALDEGAGALAAAGERLAQRGLARTGDRLVADARWLWRAFGATPGGTAGARALVADLPRNLLAGELVETELVDHVERRDPEAWYFDPSGALQLGRRKGETPGSGLERTLFNRHVFVAAEPPVRGGAYRVSARMALTTAFADASLVLAQTRRDRALRLDFRAGDWRVAAGRSDDEVVVDSVTWSMGARFLRAGGLPGLRPRGRMPFDKPRTSFEVEVLVDGPTATLLINGERAGTWTDPEGRELDGRVGFAIRSGAVRIDRVRVERLDAWESGREGYPMPVHLELIDVGEKALPNFEELAGRRVNGLEPLPQGRLIYWIGDDELGDALELVEFTELRVNSLLDACETHALRQGLVFALPAIVRDDEAARAEWRRIREKLRVPAEALEYWIDRPARLERDMDGFAGRGDNGLDWLIFVDHAGVVRAATAYMGALEHLPSPVDRFVDIWTQRGAQGDVDLLPPRSEPIPSADKVHRLGAPNR